MNIGFLIVLYLAALGTLGADIPVASNAPPATIAGVSAAKDRRTLVIRYELSGQVHDQRISFPDAITEFRYCPWIGERGIAIVAHTATKEFYYATTFLTGRNASVTPARVPAPASDEHLLGIANTFGDSIIVTAVQHRRQGSDRLTGWMFIDNCPPAGAKIGLLIPFDVSDQQAAGKVK